jgi:flagellar motor switch protein FliN
MDTPLNDVRPRTLDQLPHVEIKPAGPASGGVAHPALLRIPVTVQVILGHARMPLSEVMALGPGSVIMLDTELSQPVSLVVNGNEVARGIIMVADEKTGQLAVSLTAIAGGASVS